jgi:hypothetical protein
LITLGTSKTLIPTVRFLAVWAARNDHVVHIVNELYDLDQAAFSDFEFRIWAE